MDERQGGPGPAFETWVFAGVDLIPGREGTPHGFERRASGSSLASNALPRLTQPLPAPLPHRSSIGNWTIATVPSRPHQPSSHRVPVHVLELLHTLALSEYIEVIITCLPEWTMPAATRYRRFQRLDADRQRLSARLADQQMHMLRHYHMADYLKTITATDTF